MSCTEYVFDIDILQVMRGKQHSKIGSRWSAISHLIFFVPTLCFLAFFPPPINDRYTTHSIQNKKVQSFSSNMTNGIVNGNATLEAQFGQFLSLVRYAILIFILCSLSRHQRDEIYICPPSFEKCAARCFHPISISILQWVRRMLSCI